MVIKNTHFIKIKSRHCGRIYDEELYRMIIEEYNMKLKIEERIKKINKILLEDNN
jgi:hypothetical protein